VLAHKARQASRRIEQVKRDGMRHHSDMSRMTSTRNATYVRLALEELGPSGAIDRRATRTLVGPQRLL